MGHVYRELAEIPIPPEGRINHHDGSVSIYYKDAAGRREKTSIGKATSETTMQPNDNFRFRYPELWRQYYRGEGYSPVDIHAGLYALTLGIGYQTTLYPLVINHLGPQCGNAVMDYAMHCIDTGNDVSQLFEAHMEDRMLFSRKVFSDKWFATLLCEDLSSSQLEDLRRDWTAACVAGGVRKVWLCIDSVNEGSDVLDGNPDEGKEARQERQEAISIRAVSAEDGRPVTWSVNTGETPVGTTIDEMLRDLSALGIGVEGVSVGRDVASRDVLESIAAKGLACIAVLKPDCPGFSTMFTRHFTDVLWNLRNVVDDDMVFGITDTVPVFAGAEPSCAALFFFGDDFTEKARVLMATVMHAMQDIRKQIAEGAENISVPAHAEPYLELVKGADGSITDVGFRSDSCHKAFDGLGFQAVASSRQQSAEEIYQLYHRYDTSGKLFTVRQSRPNLCRPVSRSAGELENRAACAFIASIIQWKLDAECRALGVETDVMLRRLSSTLLRYTSEDTYEVGYSIPSMVREILGRFGIEAEHFKLFALEMSQQLKHVELPPVRVIPDLHPEQKKGGSQQKVNEDTPKKKGRVKGSKNKKTLERERLEQELAAAGKLPPKRKPGRPKGSRNKKTLEREQQEQAARASGKQPPQEQPQRRRGRPKGSRNKKLLEREQNKEKRKQARLRREALNAEALSSAPSENPSSEGENGAASDGQGTPQNS